MKPKPSSAAIMTAIKLVEIYGDQHVTSNPDDPDLIRAARIIEEQTGVGEILEVLSDYMQHPSLDGSPQRQPMRKKLKELVAKHKEGKFSV